MPQGNIHDTYTSPPGIAFFWRRRQPIRTVNEKRPHCAAFLMILTNRFLAERVGFEPTVRLNVHWISSPAHSTTLPPFLLQSLFAASECCKARKYIRVQPQRKYPLRLKLSIVAVHFRSNLPISFWLSSIMTSLTASNVPNRPCKATTLPESRRCRPPVDNSPESRPGCGRRPGRNH